MIIKSNIWNLFYIIIFGAFVLLLVLIYVEYNSIKNRYYTESKNYIHIIGQTVKSSLQQEELVLDLMILELSKNNHEKNIKLFDDLLKYNNSLVGFGFLDKDGNYIYSSSNIDISKTLNILKIKTQHYSFEQTLKSKAMVLGRTYYFKPLKTWVIPLRKAIRDKNGNVIGVLVTGIKLGTKYNALGDLNANKSKNVMLVTSNNNNNKYYFLYNNFTKYLTKKDIYSNSVPDKIIDRIVNLLKTTKVHNIKTLKKINKSVTIIGYNRYGYESIMSMYYIKRYKIWLDISSKASVMYKEIAMIVLVYLFIFVLIVFLLYFMFNHISVSETRKKDELLFQAEHDELTQLPNRTYLYANVDEWIRLHSVLYSVLYLDLDNFKNINDKYGHIIGDKILIEVANRLKEFFSSDAMLIRQGGDEFIVLRKFRDMKHKDANLKLLIQTITRPYNIENKEFRIGLSVGVSMYPKDANSLEDLLRFADIAMYKAKETKNSYAFFSHDMNKKNIFKANIEEELRGALERCELYMVYQPQISSNGSLHGVEALVRWTNRKLGNVGPDEFIAVAEDTGLIIEIGDFIINKSLQDIHALQKELNTTFKLSINISVIQFMKHNCINSFLNAISSVGIDKSLITLEITETVSINNLDIVLPILNGLKDKGISISLDDFGTGYSSLNILKILPIDELKIDKSFIDDILYDEGAKTMVDSIIKIGKNLKMSTLAEGTESIEQVEELKTYGCDIFQGYYFSKPLTLEHLKTYIINKYTS